MKIVNARSADVLSVGKAISLNPEQVSKWKKGSLPALSVWKKAAEIH